MTKFAILIIIISNWMSVNAQPTASLSKNALSVEVGKTGLIYSIAMDRKLNTNFGARATIGTSFSSYLRAFSTFVGSYYLIGRNTNYFELGIDIGYLSVKEIVALRGNRAFIFPDYSIKTYCVNLNIGYRKYWKKSMFRAGTSPGYSKSGPLPGAYISYGIRF